MCLFKSRYDFFEENGVPKWRGSSCVSRHLVHCTNLIILMLRLFRYWMYVWHKPVPTERHQCRTNDCRNDIDYYSRYRPGFGFVIGCLAIFSNFVQWIFLKGKYRMEVLRFEQYVLRSFLIVVYITNL